MNKKLLTLALTVSATIALTACGDKGDAPKAEKEATTSSAPAAEQAAPAAEPAAATEQAAPAAEQSGTVTGAAPTEAPAEQAAPAAEPAAATEQAAPAAEQSGTVTGATPTEAAPAAEQAAPAAEPAAATEQAAPAAEPAAATEQAAPAAESAATQAAPVVSATGLSVTDVKVGDGAEAAAGQVVTVHYTGWLYDEAAADKRGAKFDSSVDRGQPFDFPLGAGRVIPGWEEGVAGMKIGGKRTLVIPAELGYGANGAGSAIPPNATLMFDVELLGVQ